MRYLALLCTLLLTMTTIAQPDGFTRYDDVAYNTLDEERHVLDVYLPNDDATQHPVVFMLHGGGFVAGDKNMMQAASEYFAEQGYAVVTPSYRLVPTARYPQQLHDAFCAMAWTLNHADDYNLDLSKMVFIGESAGAYLATMLATIDDPAPYLETCPHAWDADAFQPRGVVAYYMPVDLSTCDCPLAKQFAALYLGIDPQALQNNADDLRDIWADASPLVALDDSAPPFLLVHGEDDRLVPISESVYFRQVAKAAGINATLVIVADAPHGYFPAFGATAQRTLPSVEAFIRDVLSTANEPMSESGNITNPEFTGSD